jgi:hypothetical protein
MSSSRRFCVLVSVATLAIAAHARGQTIVPPSTTTAPATAATITSIPGAASTTSGSVGCTAITQAAANGMTARVNADNTTINPPQSITGLTCLSNFFNGIGLNLITNLLNPQTLLNAVAGQVCNLVKQEWNSLIGQVQCGLTITGFNLGFGGIGGGLSCPKLSFGGGGPPIGSIGIGVGSGGGLYIKGAGLTPTGYTLPNVPAGTY